jgi:hypothetical protein
MLCRALARVSEGALSEESGAEKSGKLHDEEVLGGLICGRKVMVMKARTAVAQEVYICIPYVSTTSLNHHLYRGNETYPCSVSHVPCPACFSSTCKVVTSIRKIF